MIFYKSELEKHRGKEVRLLTRNIETLDMGGANGWMISNSVSPKNVTVIDLDRKMLQKNPAKNKIYGDLTKNTIKSKSFEQVTLFEVIEHIENKRDRLKVFSEAYRILEENGKFIISTPNYNRLSTKIRNIIMSPRKYPYPVAGEKDVSYSDWHYFEYTENSIKRDLMEAGFKKIKTYCKFIQIPYLQSCINMESKIGLVLYAIAKK